MDFKNQRVHSHTNNTANQIKSMSVGVGLVDLLNDDASRYSVPTSTLQPCPQHQLQARTNFRLSAIIKINRVKTTLKEEQYILSKSAIINISRFFLCLFSYFFNKQYF